MQNAKKITSILIIVSMSMVMFSGCGSTTGASTTNTTKSKTMQFNPTATKTLYTNTLKTLVTAKTITQAQSDKVLAAVTKNVPQGTVAGKTKRTTPNNNQITALVKSGVITQIQADTINTKISEGMKNNKSNQSK